MLNTQVEIEFPLCLDHFAGANRCGRARNRTPNVCVLKTCRKGERMCKEAIAQQNTQRISPARIRGRLRAATHRFVHYVVVHKCGEVDELDNHGKINMSRVNLASCATS